MKDSMKVDVAALAEHARTLNTLTGEIQSALDTAMGASMPGGAYGELAQEFSALLHRVVQAGRETLQVGVAALDTATTDMRATASMYEQRETGTAATFDGRPVQ